MIYGGADALPGQAPPPRVEQSDLLGLTAESFIGGDAGEYCAGEHALFPAADSKNTAGVAAGAANYGKTVRGSSAPESPAGVEF